MREGYSRESESTSKGFKNLLSASPHSRSLGGQWGHSKKKKTGNFGSGPTVKKYLFESWEGKKVSGRGSVL